MPNYKSLPLIAAPQAVVSVVVVAEDKYDGDVVVDG